MKHKQNKPQHRGESESLVSLRMNFSIAGPGGFRAKRGSIIQAEPAEAKRLIESGQAVAVTSAETRENMKAPILGEYRRNVESAMTRAKAG